MCKSKIHRATITANELLYEGSISIDQNLLEAADIVPYEKVQIANVSNGERLETYAIIGKRGSGEICLNGAAARLGMKGDEVIIMAFAPFDDEELQNFKPKIVFVNKNNKIKKK